MSKIEEYAYLWEGDEPGWCLVDIEPDEPEERDRYVVYNSRTRRALVIEEDDVHALVVGRLLAKGVEVLPASALAAR